MSFRRSGYKFSSKEKARTYIIAAVRYKSALYRSGCLTLPFLYSHYFQQPVRAPANSVAVAMPWLHLLGLSILRLTTMA